MPVMSAHSDQDTAIRDQLVMEHVGLVKAMASRLATRLPPQVEVSELVSVGVLGLIDAAGRFRPSLGVPFSAFARRRIHGAMLDSLRGLDWAPRAVRKLRRDVDAAIANLRFELGREPEAADIARALDVSESEYEKMLDRLKVAELASIRQSATTEDGHSRSTLKSNPVRGRTRGSSVRRCGGCWPAPSSSCRNASGRFLPSTTRKSSRWRKSARSSASANRACHSCAARRSRACAQCSPPG